MDERIEIFMWGTMCFILGYAAIYIFRLDTDYISKAFMLLFLAVIGFVIGLLVLSLTTYNTRRSSQ